VQNRDCNAAELILVRSKEPPPRCPNDQLLAPFAAVLDAAGKRARRGYKRRRLIKEDAHAVVDGHVVISFSRKTRGEVTKGCISASLALSKYRQALSALKCDGLEQGGEVMNRFEMHDSNSTIDRAVHAGAGRLRHIVKGL
jgi:hypothetical protein